ncbi:hypothetical protein [Actinoplanes sp. NPDC026670]|uniref:hypothetical protein n=1 Tax=Actinoplanes sp. NPDC026670 TaxID=3154700 RepID=UPI0033F067D8
MGQRHGSLVNLLVSNTPQRDPEVGDHATVLMWSDRRAVEIAEVRRFKTGKRAGQVKEVTVKPLKVTRVSGSAHDGSARYTYESDPEATVGWQPFKRNESGKYRQAGDGGWSLAIGKAEEYSDPSY